VHHRPTIRGQEHDGNHRWMFDSSTPLLVRITPAICRWPRVNSALADNRKGQSVIIALLASFGRENYFGQNDQVRDCRTCIADDVTIY